MSCGPGGVPISGFAMLQHQIKAVHESAHQEEKQRQDQGDLERRPLFNSHSPSIIDRDGMRRKAAVILSSSPLGACAATFNTFHVQFSKWKCSLALTPVLQSVSLRCDCGSSVIVP